jgi:hypothetical protein
MKRVIVIRLHPILEAANPSVIKKTWLNLLMQASVPANSPAPPTYLKNKPHVAGQGMNTPQKIKNMFPHRLIWLNPP